MMKDATEDLEALRSLAAFLPEVTAEGARFGAFPPADAIAPDTAFVSFDFNDLGERFHELGHTIGAGLTAADWDIWEREAKWRHCHDDPSYIASLTARDLRCLVVRIVRAERFCDGAMQTAIDLGLVERATRRAATLLAIPPPPPTDHPRPRRIARADPRPKFSDGFSRRGSAERDSPPRPHHYESRSVLTEARPQPPSTTDRQRELLI